MRSIQVTIAGRILLGWPTVVGPGRYVAAARRRTLWRRYPRTLRRVPSIYVIRCPPMCGRIFGIEIDSLDPSARSWPLAIGSRWRCSTPTQPKTPSSSRPGSSRRSCWSTCPSWRTDRACLRQVRSQPSRGQSLVHRDRRQHARDGSGLPGHRSAARMGDILSWLTRDGWAERMSVCPSRMPDSSATRLFGLLSTVMTEWRSTRPTERVPVYPQMELTE